MLCRMFTNSEFGLTKQHLHTSSDLIVQIICLPVPNSNGITSVSSVPVCPHPTLSISTLGKGMVKMQQQSSVELADSNNVTSSVQNNVNQMTSSTRSEQTTRTFQESYSTSSASNKTPLKLLMDPRGQVQNIDTLQRQYELQPMSPDLCAEVVSALNEAGGKGAELFAKRRKKSEKWVVDETNFNNNVNSLQQPKSVTPTAHVANVPPAFTEFGQQRAQQNIKLNQIQVGRRVFQLNVTQSMLLINRRSTRSLASKWSNRRGRLPWRQATRTRRLRTHRNNNSVSSNSSISRQQRSYPLHHQRSCPLLRLRPVLGPSTKRHGLWRRLVRL